MKHQRLFNNPKIMWSRPGEMDVPEQAIAGHIDDGDTICLEQEGQTVVLNAESVPDLVRMLKELRRDVFTARIRRAQAGKGAKREGGEG